MWFWAHPAEIPVLRVCEILLNLYVQIKHQTEVYKTGYNLLYTEFLIILKLVALAFTNGEATIISLSFSFILMYTNGVWSLQT